MREITRRSMVRLSEVEYATHCVNHVLGCKHGCLYCYAYKKDRRYGRVTSREDWSDPQLAINALEIVDREMGRRSAAAVERVHLSFMTDPFMFDSETGGCVDPIAESSVALIQRLNQAGKPVTVLTKGVYPDALVAALPGLNTENQYGITVTSLNPGYVEEWEPKAAPPDDRIRGLSALSQAGARTWVSLEPYPTPNIDPTAENLDVLLAVLRPFDKLVFGKMNYVPAVKAYEKLDPSFYERIAGRFIAWCEANGKSYHVKRSTPLSDGDPADFMSRM
jgi:DNA repair photolyase